MRDFLRAAAVLVASLVLVVTTAMGTGYLLIWGIQKSGIGDL